MIKNKLIYDLVLFDKESYGGISRMWQEIFAIICKIKNNNIDFIKGKPSNITFDFLEKESFFGKNVIDENINFFKTKIRVFSFYRSIWLYFFLLKKAKKEHITFHSTDYINPILKVKNCKIITTIHDMVFWDQSDRFKKNIDYYDKKLSIINSLRVSDRIITVSNTSKDAIISYFPNKKNKIKVIYHGINNKFLNQNFIDKKRKSFVFLGGRNSYKNFNLLIESFIEFNKINNDWIVEVIGENSSTKEHELEYYKRVNIQEKVIDYGLISDDKLINILKSAGCLVIPSLNEGFNFPLIEGLALGVPILSSNILVSKELGRNYVKYFNPTSKQELIKLMLELSENGYNKGNLIEGMIYAQKFNWQESFNKLMNEYQSLEKK